MMWAWLLLFVSTIHGQEKPFLQPLGQTLCCASDDDLITVRWIELFLREHHIRSTGDGYAGLVHMSVSDRDRPGALRLLRRIAPRQGYVVKKQAGYLIIEPKDVGWHRYDIPGGRAVPVGAQFGGPGLPHFGSQCIEFINSFFRGYRLTQIRYRRRGLRRRHATQWIGWDLQFLGEGGPDGELQAGYQLSYPVDNLKPSRGIRNVPCPCLIRKT